MEPVYILHRHRYWTEHLDFLLKDKTIFFAVASRFAEDPTYKGKELPYFDPEKHKTILSPGVIDDPTDHNNIIVRMVHSPGFFMVPFLKTHYCMVSNHTTSQFQMLVYEKAAEAIMLRDTEHPFVDAMRYQFIQDKRVKKTQVDLVFYDILEAAKKEQRRDGTALIAMRWIIMFTEFNKILKVIETLNKFVKVSIVLHPLVSRECVFYKKIKELEGNLLEKVYYNLSRPEMVDLYDQFEYIVSDGSGSCYEALLRGCKPLAVRNFYDEFDPPPAIENAYDILEEEYFPFQSYEEIDSYRHFDGDAFLRKLYPFLFKYNRSEAEAIARQEILDLLPEFGS